LETKEQEKKLAVDQASETERLRWLHEIHDGLGSHLIAARFLADKAKSLEDFEIVKQSIDEGIEELRELVDSLSPEPSTLPELLGAMRYRITNRFESAGITLRWIVEPMIEAGDLSPIEALHVQRIAQEALTNILKHANASTVCVHIFTQGPLMILRIDDDGAGFDRKGEQRGNGLVSMQARAQKIGGEITLSNLASGTRVELIISNI
jgi:signal transduction histidine kinase